MKLPFPILSNRVGSLEFEMQGIRCSNIQLGSLERAV